MTGDKTHLTHFANACAVIVFLFSLVLAAFVVWGCYNFFGPGYYAELNEVRAKCEAIPGVRVVEIRGNEDISLEDIWVNLHVVGNGRLKLDLVTPESFVRTDHLYLSIIGPYEVEVQGIGYDGVHETATGKPIRTEFWGSHIDIGSNGAFAGQFPFELYNVGDVIEHFEEILSVLSDWPPATRKSHFRSADGTDYRYGVKRARSSDKADSTGGVRQ